MQKPRRFLTLVVVLLISGCGQSDGDSRPKISITGTVTLNGKAINGTRVHLVLQPLDNSRRTILEIKADGTYEGEAVVGENRVLISPKGAPGSLALLRIPEIYDTDSSPAKISVTEEKTEYPIELKSKP